ncbi:MAG: hypothetical protein H7Y09_15725, partial [Chitinophagaceae bacterium]|nr:hypothetical protein [Anaerolineae bacterium]
MSHLRSDLAPGIDTRHITLMSNVTSAINKPPPLKAAIIPVTPLQQNCTLFWCTETNKGALVDPGGDL